MKKLLVFCLLMLPFVAAAQSNRLWSQTTVSNYVYTNLYLASNSIHFYQLSNTTYQISNAMWFFTNGVITTNLSVIRPGSTTNWILFTNGTVRAVTNAAP